MRVWNVCQLNFPCSRIVKKTFLETSGGRIVKSKHGCPLEIDPLNKPLASSELWIDGPNAVSLSDQPCPDGEKWVDGPKEFLLHSAGIHGYHSPKIKKKSSHKNHNGDPVQDSLGDFSGADLHQRNIVHTVKDRNYEGSPSKTERTVSTKLESANVHSKNSQKHVHKSRKLRIPAVTDEIPPNSPLLNYESSPGHLRTTTSTKPVTVVSGDRTAEWVKSVQESNLSKFSQLLHSRKELIKSFHSPKHNRHRLKPVLFDYIRNAQTLATFDHPTAFFDLDSEHEYGNNSPPPDYASCMADCQLVLDINENKADVSNNSSNASHENSESFTLSRQGSLFFAESVLPIESNKLSSKSADVPDDMCLCRTKSVDVPLKHRDINVHASCSYDMRSDSCMQFSDTPVAVPNSNTKTRLCNPDGASNPNLSSFVESEDGERAERTTASANDSNCEMNSTSEMGATYRRHRDSSTSGKPDTSRTQNDLVPFSPSSSPSTICASRSMINVQPPKPSPKKDRGLFGSSLLSCAALSRDKSKKSSPSSSCLRHLSRHFTSNFSSQSKSSEASSSSSNSGETSRSVSLVTENQHFQAVCSSSQHSNAATQANNFIDAKFIADLNKTDTSSGYDSVQLDNENILQNLESSSRASGKKKNIKRKYSIHILYFN